MAQKREEPAADKARTQEIRKKAKRFRILIIGRANAGKTTILKKVCNTTEEPATIRNSNGERIDPSILTPSVDRGMHDINNEMIFRSNPGFVFHDSRGFEAGTPDELNRVKEFITQRANERKLRDRVHAIWYCIPMDNDRPVTKAEDTFFTECGTGHVPVVVIFTKFDALDDQAFGTLKRENPNISHTDALQQAPLYAHEQFEESRRSLRIFYSRYPPKNYVCLRDMDQPTSNCFGLLEKTAAALDDETLQAMFVSTQRCTLTLCTRYAIAKLLSRTSNMGAAQTLTSKEVQKIVLKWYPHILDVSMSY